MRLKLPWRKERKYVLRARNSNTGLWEDVEEYDRKVDVSEIRDTIDELKADGYDYFQLIEVSDKKKVLWSKIYKSARKKAITAKVDDLVETLNSMARLQDTLKKVLGVEGKDLFTTISENLAILETIRNLRERYPELFGETRSQPTNSSLEELKELISTIEQLRRIAPTTPAPTPTPTPVPSGNIVERALREATSSVAQAQQKAIETVVNTVRTPCEVAETCVEEEGAESES